MSITVTYTQQRNDFSLPFSCKNALYSMIDLTIFPDDDRRRELITRYWKLSSNGSDFTEPMKSIKEEFELSRGAILGIVRSGSEAVSRIHVCKCGHRKEFNSRKDFRSTPTQKPYVCEECREERSPSGQSPEGSDEELPGSGSAEPEDRSPAEEKLAAGRHQRPMEDLFGEISSGERLEEQAPALSGKEEKRLRQRLRRLARGLSRASQMLERFSHQINESNQ
jgi:hypothetical protein